MNQRINDIIQNEIRPALQNHFGDIELADYQSGIVTVRLLGACRGCLSARDTLQDVVLSGLQAKIPEVKEVLLNTDVSEELLEAARNQRRGATSGEDWYQILR